MGLLATRSEAQRRDQLPGFLLDPAYRGSRIYEKKAVHDGNEIAISFFNYGLLGGTGEVRGNWPKGSRDFYVGDVLPLVALEIPIDRNKDGRTDTLVNHVVTTRGPRAGVEAQGPPGQSGVFWGFEAKPGFAAATSDKPAISTDTKTWPRLWPDQPSWINPATGLVDWNGFFGRGIQNADLESYFWMDDESDAEMYTRFGFLPDSTDQSRRGQGIAVKVRGLQWSQFLAQDAAYFLYEVTNTSTTTYPRVAVGLTVGTLAGGDGDSQDDMAFFDQANRIVYSWDFDNSGNERQEVGYVGYAFMESPGDAINGIDDDGDGDPLTDQGRDIEGRPYVPLNLAGASNTFTSADFQPRTLSPGDPLILIDDQTGRRSVQYLGSAPVTVTSQGRSYTVAPGVSLREMPDTLVGQGGGRVAFTRRNLIDEDLDGIIDEDVNLHFERRQEAIEGGVRTIVTLPSLRYKNYVGLARAVRDRAATRQDSLDFGLLNPMIDEAADDGIDNDGDWDPIGDDVGADGVVGTGDQGEGNGRPDRGEPNYDALDVDETDQVGLTSFYYFTPPGGLRMNDDTRLWQAMAPGFFTTNQELQQQQQAGGIDGDFIFSSGYFRLLPGQTLRFSLALVFGEDLADITNNVQTVQEIYNRNYNFARPPERPTVAAVPGDNRVTIYWDSRAEDSRDPVLGDDFEGYRVYRSTDPFFTDPKRVTDVFGNPAVLAPVAQFDRNNGRKGLYRPGLANNLYDRVRGTPFFLGDDTGLRYSFTDTTVQNGRTYYYAVTAYDRGDTELGFYPAENNFAVSVAEDGSVITGANVVEVRPNAAALGYRAGTLGSEVRKESGSATGEVFVEVLDPMMLRENAGYTVTFPTDTTFTVASEGRILVSSQRLTNALSAIFDGMRLSFRNEATRLNEDRSGWVQKGSKGDVFAGVINISRWRYTGVAVPYDYEVRFSNDFTGQSLGGVRLGTFGPAAVAVPTNFTVTNTTLGRSAEFVFYEENEATRNGRLDAVGESIYIYETVNGVRQPAFIVRLAQDYQGAMPGAGDVARVVTHKPFSTTDRYTFSTRSSTIDAEEIDLDRIKVVPNPYVAAANWERPLPPTITSGRGERRIDFIHLPQNAVIRIYTVRGELLRELRHEGAINDGTVSWDLRTREGLDIAYGVYFYHVKVDGIGEKTGKFAIIK